jgi:hypothetical protein
MVDNEKILEMDPKKNAKIKKALMKTGLFEKASYTPYIGDEYEDAKEKILFIGDCKLPYDKRFLKESKDFPKVNYCTQIISYCSRETTKRKIRDEIKNEMNLDGENERPTFAYPQKIQSFSNLKKISFDSISYCNFVYDRFDRVKKGSIKPNQIPSGEELIDYLRVLKEVFNILNPHKVFFVDNATNEEVNNRKKVSFFDGKNFRDWICGKNIECKNLSGYCENVVEKEISFDTAQEKRDIIKQSEWIICEKNLENIEREIGNVVRKVCSQIDGDKLNRLLSEENPDLVLKDEIILPIDKWDAVALYVYQKKIEELKCHFKLLKKVYKEGDLYGMNDKLKKREKMDDFIFMLNFLENENYYIEYTSIPNMLKYISELREKNKDRIPGLDEKETLSRDGFYEYVNKKSNEKGKGVANILKSICSEMNSSPDEYGKYREIMKNKVFMAVNKRLDFKILNKEKYNLFKKDRKIDKIYWKTDYGLE